MEFRFPGPYFRQMSITQVGWIIATSVLWLFRINHLHPFHSVPKYILVVLTKITPGILMGEIHGEMSHMNRWNPSRKVVRLQQDRAECLLAVGDTMWDHCSSFMVAGPGHKVVDANPFCCSWAHCKFPCAWHRFEVFFLSSAWSVWLFLMMMGGEEDDGCLRW